MQVDWFFDFVSPYSYLQCERLASLGLPIRPRPLLFAALLNHWGHKGPAEMPTKRTFVYRQVQWLAGREGIALRFPPRHPFNPVRALRLAIVAGSKLDAVLEIYRHIWGEGDDVDTPEGFARLVKRLGVQDAEARISDPAVKEELRRNGEEAIAAGVFGVPTLSIGGQLFWGYDATDMALDYLRDPVAFISEEIRRLDALPVGASRAVREP